MPLRSEVGYVPASKDSNGRAAALEMGSVSAPAVVSPSYHGAMGAMGFPIKICSVCGEEFELKPDKPGFANRCRECSTEEATASPAKGKMDADERKNLSEANAARRQAMRDLLYRKDS